MYILNLIWMLFCLSILVILGCQSSQHISVRVRDPDNPDVQSMSDINDDGRYLPQTTCQCYVYGFGEHICADLLFQDGADISDVSKFTFLINSVDKDGSLLGDYIMFLNQYGECQTVAMVHKTVNITMIKYCPRDVTDSLKEQCENPTLILTPIDFKGPVNLAFRNIYCAMCHGVSVEYVRKNFSAWKPIYSCNNGDSSASGNITYALETDICETRYIVPSMVNLCLPEVKQYFHRVVENKCMGGLIDKKIDCNATCIECTVCCFAGQALNPKCFEEPIGHQLSVLFALPTEAEVEVAINGQMFTSSQLCQDDENFDLLFQKCRNFVCPQRQFAKQGKCLEDDTRFMSAKSQPLPNGSMEFLVEIQYSINNVIGVSSILRKMTSLIPGNITVVRSTIRENTEITLLFIESMWSISSIVKNWRKILLQPHEGNVFHIHVSNFMNETSLNNSCLSGVLQCFNNSMTYFLNSQIFAEMIYENKPLYFPIDNILYNFTISRNESKLTFSEICVCSPKNDGVDNPLNCSFPLYKYDLEEYVVLENGDLELHKTNLRFDDSKFYIDNVTASVCSDPNHDNQFFRLDDVQMYLSIACTGISILFLVITVVLYLIFAELRNLPGKLTLGLSVFMIFGQSLLFVQDLEKSVCKYVATLTHFCWLSVFLWMSCIACNMLLTFHPRMALTSAGWRGNRAFGTYCTICLIIPGLVCATLLILDIIKGDHFHIQYGVVSCFWMSNKYGYIYSFFVPVAVTLLVNLICFCFTLFYIEKTMKSSEEVTGRKREKSRCKIYIRLSSVMGFAWMFGFIASVADVSALWYIYIVLNGLQGVFIFISFSINTRTHRLLRNKMSAIGLSSIFTTQDENRPTMMTTTQVSDTLEP